MLWHPPKVSTTAILKITNSEQIADCERFTRWSAMSVLHADHPILRDLLSTY